MSPSVVEFLDRLSSELAETVHLPGSPGYASALGHVFFPEASRRHPPGVVTPKTVDDVQTIMRLASETGAQITVRGGGLSSNCIADVPLRDAWTLLGRTPADGDSRRRR